jgi:hypothetical protein
MLATLAALSCLSPEALRRMSARRPGDPRWRQGTIDRRCTQIGQPTERGGLSIPQLRATNESDCTLAS